MEQVKIMFLLLGTISLWVKFDTVSAGSYLFFNSGAETLNIMRIGFKNGGHPHFSFYDGSDYIIEDDTLTFTTGTWYHIIATWGSAGMELFVNNVSRGTDAYTGNGSGDRPMFIGCKTNQANVIDGNIDEVGIWSRALTPTERANLYNSVSYISEEEDLENYINTPTGTANKDTFWIANGTTWVEFNHYEYFRVKKRQNQSSEFEIKIYDISTAQKAYFKEQAKVLFFAGETMILKGIIQNIEYSSAYEVIATGIGMEAKLLNKQFIKSGDNRVQYSNTSAQTIASEINDFTLTTASSGLWASDFGNISMRFEHANKLNALAKTADAIDYYWWISQTSSDNYAKNYLNIASNQGETSSQKTFALGSTSTKTSQEKDIANVVNYVYGLGYGDGVNQLKTSVYAASTQSSFLASNITATDSSIGLVDSSDFDATGSARIAEEQFTYAGISSNTLTGCTRGVNSTTAKPHNKLCYVEQHFDSDSPQTGSSIQTYGLMDHSLIDKSIIDLETLEVISSGYLSDRKTPIIRIKITSDEPLTDASLNIGDNVTVTDAEANISGDYRIVGMEYTSNYGVLSLEIEVSNKSLEFVEQMSKAKQDAEDMQKYMQGATNLYAITETSEGDASNYVNIRFFMPSEAVAMNKVLLNFKMKPIKTFQTVADSDTDNDISGTKSNSTWEDTGGSVNVTVKTGEKVLLIYSMGLDPSDPLSEMDLRIQRDIDGGGYSTLNESISYFVPGESNPNTEYWSCL